MKKFATRNNTNTTPRIIGMIAILFSLVKLQLKSCKNPELCKTRLPGVLIGCVEIILDELRHFVTRFVVNYPLPQVGFPIGQGLFPRSAGTKNSFFQVGAEQAIKGIVLLI